jgi:hypothetical protein
LAHDAVSHRGLAAALFLLLTSVCFTIACGGDKGSAEPTTQPVIEMRGLMSTPEPSPTPWPILGRVLTRMEASCVLGLTGPEVTVRYGAEIEGDAEITRVRLLVDKEVREDIAHLAERTYLRETKIYAAPNRMVSVQLLVETRGAEPTPQTIHLVRCPRVPALPRA